MKKEIIKFLVLLMVALGAGPVGAAMWQWSTTAASNATADPGINWSEGMSPSSVNESARSMMAVTAAWRNDISATNTTAGTSTAYTLTTSEGVSTTPVTGQMVSFIVHASNGGSPTLTVDGGNTYPILLNGAAPGAATMIAGSPYRLAFNGSAWLLEAGYGSPYNVPLGGLLSSTVGTPPNSSFIIPSGQCISTTTYAAYWVALGSPASGSCPGGQFQVIDVRGRVIAGLDTLNGVAANRLTSSIAGCGSPFTTMGATCANGIESRTLALSQVPTGITSSGSASGSVTSIALTTRTASTAGSNDPSTLSISTFSGSLVGPITAPFAGGTFSGSASVTSNNTSGQPFPAIQPVIGLYSFLRVL